MIEIRKRCRRACGILLVLCASTFTHVACAEEAHPEKAVAEREEQPDTSVIRVMHAEIEGRVFLASEDRGLREQPAKDVSIQIRVPETDDVVAETLTDEEGAYSLPKIDVGRYQILIGGLRLNLSVEPENTRWSEELRKVIIAIIPEQMAKRK